LDEVQGAQLATESGHTATGAYALGMNASTVAGRRAINEKKKKKWRGRPWLLSYRIGVMRNMMGRGASVWGNSCIVIAKNMTPCAAPLPGTSVDKNKLTHSHHYHRVAPVILIFLLSHRPQ
jgi:hypothetical protein